MLKSAIIFIALVILAGCASPPRRDPNRPLPPDWDINQDHPVFKTLPPPEPVVVQTNQALISETNHFEETWIGLNRWAKASGFGSVEQLSLPPLEMTITNGFQWNDLNLKARTALIPLPTFSLRTTNGVLMIQPETRTAHWDGVEIHLAFTPELVQGEPLLHSLDLSKTIEPLIRGIPPLSGTNRTIVIDPDDSAESQSDSADLQNGDFALDWGQRLAALLTTNGWTVFLTHTNDMNISLVDRAAFADMHRPDLFLNLRFGIGETDGNRAGLETYCLAPASMPSNVPRSYFEETWHVFTNNNYDEENWEYTFRLHRALIRVPGVEDRGLRRSRFIDILQDRGYPAVCVNGGSLSNPRDAALIANPLFRQKLAEAIAGALQ